MYRNSTFAFYKILRLIEERGVKNTVRGGEIKEILSHFIKIDKPLERVILVPERKNNIFASIAETLWVLAGRNDIDFLSYYLPKAKEFSDNGLTWRGGYGPRLRAWGQVDQIKSVVELLNKDRYSRRAVMIIFNPGLDYVVSKDIPCNNWIQFVIRNDLLHMNIGVRSNDILWGFSGINTFEWSVLHEMMAFWTKSQVGSLSYFVGSMHLYERFNKRAQKILSKFRLKSLYDFGLKGVPFSTPFEIFDTLLRECFEIEQEIRDTGNNSLAMKRISKIDDTLIRTSVQMLNIYNAHKNNVAQATIRELIEGLPICDFKVAAIEFVTRKQYQKEVFVLQESEKQFLDFFWEKEAHTTNKRKYNEIWQLLSCLHTKKSRVYGDSWKKHGEIISIFANISRKYDRIVSINSGATPTRDEALFDTIADLAIYAVKYLTFIAEKYRDIFGEYIHKFDGVEKKVDIYFSKEGFNISLDLINYFYRKKPIQKMKIKLLFTEIDEYYSNLEEIFERSIHEKECADKCNATINLAVNSICLLERLAELDMENMNKFRDYVNDL